VVGGLPIAQPYVPYQYPAAVYGQPPAVVQQQPAVRPQPVQHVIAPRPAVARGQKPDEPAARPAPRKLALEMPSPEALGVPVPAAPPDWAELRVRLDRLGATSFSLAKETDGYRFTCQVPTAGGSRTVEGRAATEAGAVQRALATAGR
jgi:hypothetical protein